MAPYWLNYDINDSSAGTLGKLLFFLISTVNIPEVESSLLGILHNILCFRASSNQKTSLAITGSINPLVFLRILWK